MGMKHFKAYTPSRRNMTVSDFSEITKKTPEIGTCDMAGWHVLVETEKVEIEEIRVVVV